MSTFHIFTLALLVLLFNSPLSFSVDPPQTSPSPSPDHGADVPSLEPKKSPSPSVNSPPAPPPDLAPESSPSPALTPANSTEPLKKSPAPSPSEAGDVSQADSSDIEAEGESSEGMSRGKKAGIAIGVVAGVCIVGIGALVYKKRQQNIQRAQFGYAARRELL
nr:pectinesterase inhibitor 10-like [Coffea arabica]